MHFPTRLFSGEFPLDCDAVAIVAPIPGFGVSAEGSNVPDPAFAEALAAEEADRNLRLIKPASMLGRVMNGEPLPEPSARRFAESVYQRFAGVGAQVVQNDREAHRIAKADEVVGCRRRKPKASM